MAKNNKQTSPDVAKIASRLLRDKQTSANVKSVAATALAQAKLHSKKR